MGKISVFGGALTGPFWQSIEPLGDQGLLARFCNEEAALAWSLAAREKLPAKWEIVASYRTVAVFACLTNQSRLELEERLGLIAPSNGASAGRLIEIPCCYSLGPDLEEAAKALHTDGASLARMHAGAEYTVFAIGFVPGFPYMGWLTDGMSGLDRLPSPRTRVPAGSVGITGRQTGIYPAEVPGGWRLIGRTPCILADLTEGESGWFALRPGDRVRFRQISEPDFYHLFGSRPTVMETIE